MVVYHKLPFPVLETLGLNIGTQIRDHHMSYTHTSTSVGGREFVMADACSCFYPTALKSCRGIVFTHGVRMGGRRAAGNSLSGLYLRNRMV